MRRIVLSSIALLAPAVPGLALDPTPVGFTDVTAAAGIEVMHWDGVLPNQPGEVDYWYMVAGVSAGDFDQDGWTDLYVTRLLTPNSLWRNLGDGTFEDVAATAGVDFSGRSAGGMWGDVNNDGWPDLYVTVFRRNGVNLLYINNGDGTFTEDAAARGVAMAGGEDRYYSSSAFGDYDLDGDLDLVVWEWSFTDPGNALFQNDGSGHFTEVTEAANVFGRIGGREVFGWSGSFADMDNDGWVDLVTAGDFLTSRYYRNERDGTFSDRTVAGQLGTDENGMGSALGDYDHDGDLDWFVTSIWDDQVGLWGTTGNRFYRNEGDSLFSDYTDVTTTRDGDWGWGASFLDYDNDGDLDLAMTNGVNYPYTFIENLFNITPVRLWENIGGGLMNETGAALGFDDDRSGKGLAVLDYDRDGDQDIVIANNLEMPVLYRNDGGNQRDWLQVALRGTLTNSAGLGARIRVQATADSPVQMHEMTGGNNFLSQNEPIAHFGFDREVTSVAEVRVTWPASGLTQRLTDVPLNQRILVTEPCAGDTNGDLSIALDDLEQLLVRFGGPAAGPGEGDFDADGLVGLSDLALLLRNFGRACH